MGMNLFTVIMIFAPTTSPIIRAMFTIPNLALENSMACLVFRQLKLGILKTPGSQTTARSRSGVQLPIVFTRRNVGTDTSVGDGTSASDIHKLSSINLKEEGPLEVNVTQEVIDDVHK